MREPCEQLQRQKAHVSGPLNTHAFKSSLNYLDSGKCTGQSFDIETKFFHSFLMGSASEAAGSVSINCIFRAEMIRIKQKGKKTGVKFFISQCLKTYGGDNVLKRLDFNCKKFVLEVEMCIFLSLPEASI